MSINRNITSSILYFLTTGFYSGRSPIAPGTIGTIVAALLAYFLYWVFPRAVQFWPSIAVAIFLTISSIILVNLALKAGLFGEKADPQPIVLDEFAGYFTAIAGLGASPQMLILAFVAFRFFDIQKPPPVKQVELLPAGYGIVLDDVVAGVFANLAIRALMLTSLI